MSMSAEEALDVAMKECETAEWGELWAGYVIERLASLGYALHPIAIDEGAVEKAAKAVNGASLSSSIRLRNISGGVSTYTLTFDGKDVQYDYEYLEDAQEFRQKVQDLETARAAVVAYLEAVRAK